MFPLVPQRVSQAPPPLLNPHSSKVAGVDLEPIIRRCRRGVAQGIAVWDRFLVNFPMRPPLGDLLPLLAAEKAASSLFAQLCLWVAIKWEAALSAAVGGHVADVQVQGEAKRLPSAHRMQLRLARHLNATQVFSSDARPILFASMTTDKSSVGGLPLHNTFVQLNGQPSVMFALPQVGLCGSGGGVSGGVFRTCLVPA